MLSGSLVGVSGRSLGEMRVVGLPGGGTGENERP